MLHKSLTMLFTLYSLSVSMYIFATAFGRMPSNCRVGIVLHHNHYSTFLGIGVFVHIIHRSSKNPPGSSQPTLRGADRLPPDCAEGLKYAIRFR